MQRLLSYGSRLARGSAAPLGLLAAWLLSLAPAGAQPTNDNFGSATVLTGGWGSITGDSTGATAEPDEPSHGGFPAMASVWYQWTAPINGEVSLDTLNSSFDTILAVYTGTGTSVKLLTQVAANDDMFPAITNLISGVSGFGGINLYDLPFAGPSSLRFNATAGTTYYFAVDAKFGFSGQFQLNWAYHSGGVFRFATEEFDNIDYGRPNGATFLPLYQAVDTESEKFIGDESTIGTYSTLR